MAFDYVKTVEPLEIIRIEKGEGRIGVNWEERVFDESVDAFIFQSKLECLEHLWFIEDVSIHEIPPFFVELLICRIPLKYQMFFGMHQSSIFCRADCIIRIDSFHNSFDEDRILEYPDGLFGRQPTLLVHYKQIKSNLYKFELDAMGK